MVAVIRQERGGRKHRRTLFVVGQRLICRVIIVIVDGDLLDASHTRHRLDRTVCSHGFGLCRHPEHLMVGVVRQSPGVSLFIEH